MDVDGGPLAITAPQHAPHGYPRSLLESLVVTPAWPGHGHHRLMHQSAQLTVQGRRLAAVGEPIHSDLRIGERPAGMVDDVARYLGHRLVIPDLVKLEAQWYADKRGLTALAEGCAKLPSNRGLERWVRLSSIKAMQRRVGNGNKGGSALIDLGESASAALARRLKSEGFDPWVITTDAKARAAFKSHNTCNAAGATVLFEAMAQGTKRSAAKWLWRQFCRFRKAMPGEGQAWECTPYEFATGVHAKEAGLAAIMPMDVLRPGTSKASSSRGAESPLSMTN